MKFIQTKLADAWLIQPEVFKDTRGFFLESYSQKEFKKQGIDINFIQDNHSFSKQKGVLRGLHFQKPPFAQSKLVRVIRGKVYDVIVDLRKKSPTFKKWQGFELSSENFSMLLVPRGFAHGFITLEDDTDFVYKCDNYYHPESEAGIIWNDADLNINWPTKKIFLSEKDKKLSCLKNIKIPF